MSRPLRDALTENPKWDWLFGKKKKKGKESQPKATLHVPQKHGVDTPTPVVVTKGQHSQHLTKEKYLRKKKHKKPGKWISAGGVVVPSKKDFSKVLVIKPSNNYGPWAFPKGRVDTGETLQIAAVREVFEETGVHAKFLHRGKDTYLGSGRGSFSVTHFFLMYSSGGKPHPTKESEKALFVPWEQAINLFTRSGNKRDPKIAMRAMKVLGVSL